MKLNDEKIRLLMYRNDMTQTELADEAGLTRETINAVANGKSCSYMSALRIAKALEVQLEDIMR